MIWLVVVHYKVEFSSVCWCAWTFCPLAVTECFAVVARMDDQPVTLHGRHADKRCTPVQALCLPISSYSLRHVSETCLVDVAFIQVWIAAKFDKSNLKCERLPKLAYSIAHPAGIVHTIKWSPRPPQLVCRHTALRRLFCCET
jgi:hypothetical protein